MAGRLLLWQQMMIWHKNTFQAMHDSCGQLCNNEIINSVHTFHFSVMELMVRAWSFGGDGASGSHDGVLKLTGSATSPLKSSSRHRTLHTLTQDMYHTTCAAFKAFFQALILSALIYQYCALFRKNENVYLSIRISANNATDTKEWRGDFSSHPKQHIVSSYYVLIMCNNKKQHTCVSKNIEI